MRRRSPRDVGPRAWGRRIAGMRGIALHWFLLVGGGLGAVVAFAAIAEDVAEQETAAFDSAVRVWALGHRTAMLDPAFRALTRLGSPIVLGAVAILEALALWRWRGARVAAAAALSPVVALVMIALLKLLFHRVRPEGALRFLHLGYSFPSGHATGTMAVGVTLAWVIAREQIAQRWTIAVAVAFSLLVGWSRIYLDVHWATDVLGGWAIGLGIAAGGIVVYERLRVAARELAGVATAPTDAIQ
jgi:undecaprenyl-diphosphatase